VLKFHCCIGTCIGVVRVTEVDKIMEFVVTDTHFFINTDLGHHLPVISLCPSGNRFIQVLSTLQCDIVLLFVKNRLWSLER